MTVIVAGKLRDIAEAIGSGTDPKKAHLDAIGDYSGYECFHNRVLVATYIRSNKTAGGVLLADNAGTEDRFQSRCGLVLTWGPMAFKDDSVAKFGGIKLKKHDWVVFSPSNAREIFFAAKAAKGVSCRIIEDTMIDGRIDDPSQMY